MTQKIVTFSISDLAFDPREASDVLNHACTARRHHFWVRGICQMEQTVYASLLPLEPGRGAEEYIFVPLADSTPDGIVSTIEQRWSAGFDCVGSVDLGDGRFLLLLVKPRTSGA